MQLKLDNNGNAVMQNGHPVYIHPDGTEAPFDAKEAHVKIGTLTQENAARRTELKAANEKLAAFSGIDDPAAALKAMQFAASMEGKKVMDDDGIQKLIGAAIKPIQEKLAATEAALQEKDGHIYKLEVSNRFQSSQFVKDKVNVPPDMLEATFGKQFKVDGGKMVATDAAGNVIYSKIKAGEPAGFDEAIQTMIDSHPMKDTIYRASGASGAGSQSSSGGGGQQKTMTRAAWDQASHADRANFAKSGGQVVDE